MQGINFKKYPSCGVTIGPTDAILALIGEHDLAAEDVARVEVTVSPHACKLVGNPFELGENPKVNAQFNIPYCMASALLRKSSKLRHFDEASIRDPRVMELAKIVQVIPEDSLEDPVSGTYSTSSTVRVTTKAGNVFDKTVDVPRGYWENPLTREEHLEHFRDCVDYSGNLLPPENIEKIQSMVGRIEEAENVLSLIPLLLADRKQRSKNNTENDKEFVS